MVRRRALAALGALALLGGCATRQSQADNGSSQIFSEGKDPLEGFNRAMYHANTVIDRYTLRPAAVAYVHVVPRPVRTGISNILGNLSSPLLIGNDMLQGKPRLAGDSLMRFVINTTIGGLGTFDVANDLGYHAHSNDFGITLASWGVGGSPYLFLPILGPGDPRDSAGRVVDLAGDPLSYIGQGVGVTAANWTRFGLTTVSERADYLGTFSQIRKTALDPYATFRSLYRQHRAGEIEHIESYNKHTVPAWFPAPAHPAEEDDSSNQ
jgi:phospholipid-binding lipoprotein MlaA